ncbi:hypothetical protein HK098_007132, partial [Nowakowskiella sp. JEL0407]
LLISASTSGTTAIFNISKTLETVLLHIESSQSPQQENITSSGVKYAQTNWQPRTASKREIIDIGEPDLKCIGNQSGVNGLDVNYKDGKLRIATGGDDNTLSVFQILLTVSLQNELMLICTSIGRNMCAHASNITGVKILSNGSVVTSSIDQRLNIWSVEERDEVLDVVHVGFGKKSRKLVDSGSGEVRKMEIAMEYSGYVDVADVSDLDCLEICGSDEGGGRGVRVVIVGVGMQVFQGSL